VNFIFYCIVTAGLVFTMVFLVTYLDTRRQKKRIRSLVQMAEKRKLSKQQEALRNAQKATSPVYTSDETSQPLAYPQQVSFTSQEHDRFHVSKDTNYEYGNNSQLI
jgi:hypothetical protein